jgi:lipoprotein-anchoring transpeptidase ErfK/SrfK
MSSAQIGNDEAIMSFIRKFWVSGVLAAFCVSVLAGSASARELVVMDKSYPLGAIVIVNSERNLYYSLGNGMALRYRVAVGEPHMQWTGQSFVQSKRANPSWTPPPAMRRRKPYLPAYMPPGPKNPLGVRAIYLGWTEYRIHGTVDPGSIGRAASSGCIRMHNADVIDLYDRVHIGAPVYVLR